MNRAEKRRQKKLQKKSNKAGVRQIAAPIISEAQARSFQTSLEKAASAHAAGHIDEAERLCQSVLDIDPTQPFPINLCGMIAIERGDYARAIELLSSVIKQEPEYAEAYVNLGNAYRGAGQLEKAIDSYKRAVSYNPKLAVAYHNLGNIHMDADRLEDAAQCYVDAINTQPHFAEALVNLGNVHKATGDAEKAVECYQRAISIDASLAVAHNNLGNAQRETGRVEDAAASYRRAIDARPDYAEAHRHLARVVKHTEHDADIRAMEELYAAGQVDPEQKMHLAYALGMAFENIGDYTKAFTFLNDANTYQRQTCTFSIQDERARFRRLKKVFDAAFFAGLETGGSEDETPIFILGMPRSGTSLIEQILASHANVTGGGELKAFNDAVQQLGGEDALENTLGLDVHVRDAIGRDYVTRVRRIDRSAPHITDKLPMNFLNVGMIKAVLPRAKVIHCTRDPADTCLSIFKNFFNEPHPYSHNLGELGSYYRLYRDLMTHWHAVVPGFVHDIAYEDIVSDPREQISRLLGFCGLDWDEACVNFHKTDRVVQTASAEQVRKPIYRDSVRLYQRYEKQLVPLMEALEQV